MILVPDQPPQPWIVTVTCTQAGCEVQLQVLAEHRHNVAPTWRCRAHRPRPEGDDDAA